MSIKYTKLTTSRVKIFRLVLLALWDSELGQIICGAPIILIGPSLLQSVLSPLA